MAQEKPEDVDDKAYYQTAVQEKNELISQLNETNYHNVQENEFVEVIDGLATFVSEDLVKISLTTEVKKYMKQSVLLLIRVLDQIFLISKD